MIFLCTTTALDADPDRPSKHRHGPFAGHRPGAVSDEIESNTNNVLDGQLPAWANAAHCPGAAAKRLIRGFSSRGS
jgi:hypothetical protein